MSLVIVLLLSVVQGLTEFLPVSSSGHLWIIRWLSGHEPDLLFDVVVHVGTLLAVVVYFRRDIVSLVTTGSGRRTLALIALGSAPTAAIGLGLKPFVEEGRYGSLFIGCMLLMTGFALLIADRAAKPAVPDTDSENKWFLTWKMALIIGVVQGLTVIPGISRSGATIAAGLLLGLNRHEAYRFAFLLSIPAVSGAFLLKVLNLESITLLVNVSTVLAMTVSAVIGLGSLWILKKMIVKSGQLTYFSIYVWLVGGLLVAGS
ncbi:MAG: undecaprenyl-diphosphate phosphatase, partial [bacterium]|nr:undecaprenyl-diphosphate phosphatase [bacterium]